MRQQWEVELSPLPRSLSIPHCRDAYIITPPHSGDPFPSSFPVHHSFARSSVKSIPSSAFRMLVSCRPIQTGCSISSVIILLFFSFLYPQLSRANPSCTYLEIPVSATASNEVFPIPTDLNYSDPAAISALVQTVIGDGVAPFPVIPTTFDGIIAARYCPPEVEIANRSDVVQLFMSGVTENNLYWFGLGYPDGFNGDMYSTVDYASKQGYPTLVIDRIGVGNSTQPDPILQQQIPLEEAISHQLVTMLKAGTAVPGKAFDMPSTPSCGNQKVYRISTLTNPQVKPSTA